MQVPPLGDVFGTEVPDGRHRLAGRGLQLERQRLGELLELEPGVDVGALAVLGYRQIEQQDHLLLAGVILDGHVRRLPHRDRPPP